MSRTTRSALAAGAAAAALAAVAPAAQAAFPGANGPIAFPVKTDTPYLLWEMPLDGPATSLTTLPGNAQSVEYSPDGKRIVFDHWEPGVGAGIYVAKADGSGAKRLSPPSVTSDRDPSWSPDGQTIIFTTLDDELNATFVRLMDDTGANRREPLVGTAAEEAVFSPDGTKIAYVVERDDRITRSERGRFEPYLIYTANPDGSDARLVAFGEDVEWTPDGATLVYRWDAGEVGEETLWRIDADDPEAQPVEIGGGWEFDYLLDPAVSPDGTQVVFEGRWNVSSTSEDPPWSGVGVMNMDGTGARRLAAGKDGEAPDWGVGEPPKDKPEDEPKDEAPGGQQTTQAAPAAPRIATPTAAAAQPSVAVARRCVSRRLFAIRVRGKEVRSATVLVNGRPAKVRRRDGRLGASVNLRTLPKGRFTVRIRKTMADGSVRSEVRRYRTCTPKPRA